MSRPSQESIDTFMSVTGASESVAVRRLQEHGGNISDAVEAHFNEGCIRNPYHSHSSFPQRNLMNANGQIQAGQSGIQQFVNAARNFRPSLLLDPNYRRDIYNTSMSTFTRRLPSIIRPVDMDQVPSQSNTWHGQHHYTTPTPFVGDANHTSSSSSSSGIRERDIEEQMIKAAIEASKQEVTHLEDDDITRAISLSLKTAEHEKVMRDAHVISNNEELGDNGSGAVPGDTSNGRWKLDGITTEEFQEAVLVEAAFFGDVPSQTRSDLQHSSHLQTDQDKIAAGPILQAVPSSPSRLTSKQPRIQPPEANNDTEMNTSTTAEKCSSGEEPTKEISEEEEQGRSREPSLPPEPALDNEDAVSLLVRMPDGSRHCCRLLKSDKLQLLFDFINVSKNVTPGSYKVVRPYPRRVFNSADSSLTLSEVGLTSKQEALFLEMV